LVRVHADVGFEIDRLIEAQPIFSLIQRYAGVPDTEMFEVFNMGIGFCYVVDPASVDLTLSILKRHGRHAQPIGHAVSDRQKQVRVLQRNLIGQHKTFSIEERATRKVG
jgi:phosphoribosylformylglycinamidine cyclo-ligase